MTKKLNGLLTAVVVLAAITLTAKAQVAEDFNNVPGLTGNGWVFTNNSSPAGTTSWMQGNAGVFPAQSGPTNSYAASNFLAAGFGGNVSNWLITPTLSFGAAPLLTFWTQSAAGAPDRLEVRLSTNGFSANVGSTDTSVGDFTTLLLSINPTQTSLVYPSGWTQFSVPIPALSGTLGRLAFRYFITDTSLNGDYIGVDTVRLTGVSAVPETTGLIVPFIGFIIVLGARRLRNAQVGGEV